MSTATATFSRTNTVNKYRAAEMRRDFQECISIAEHAAVADESRFWRALWTRWADMAIRNANFAAEQARVLADAEAAEAAN